MHIKQVIIEGFKSYKEQIVAEPFSPQINCIVGANGSGKSNFFHAIRFVISDVFSSLRAEERQQLLHEGAGHGVKQAYVEVVFDNSDGRFPIDKDEIRLRRLISTTKDEYYLDKKHKTKAEIINFLESAGFSRANPYYVVQQGKIIRMAAMKDEERLELLKEIGGTNVYEERRKDSLRIMQDTEARREQIEENVAYLESKLAELDSERKELAEYQALEKARKSLEYTLYDKEQREAKAGVDKIDEQRQKATEASHRKRDEAAELRNKAKALDKEIKTLSQRHSVTSSERSALAERKTSALKQRAATELDVQELQERIGTEESTSKQSGKELDDLRRRVEENQAQLEFGKAQLGQCQAQKRELDRALQDKEHRLKDLYSKQGRNQQYNSVAERDDAIKGEITRLEKSKATKLDTLKQQQAQMTALLAEQAKLQQDGERLTQELAGLQQSLAAAEVTAADRAAQRNARHDERKELWRRDAELKKKLAEKKDQVAKRNEALNQHGPRDIMKAMKAVERIAHEHNIPGVHGVLMELIEAQPQLNTAVEAIAGNSLFNVVVDDSGIATRITERLIKEKAGRISFLPLRELHCPPVQYPTEYGNDVVPMVRKIKHDPRFSKAVEQVFNRALICKDRMVADQVNASHEGKFTCVMMDGECVHRKGQMSGGFFDQNRSKVDVYRKVREARAELEACEPEVAALQAELANAEGANTLAGSEAEAANTAVSQLRVQLAAKREELKQIDQLLNQGKNDLEHKEKRITSMQESIHGLDRSITSKRAELDTPLLSSLTDAERAEVEGLHPEIKALQEQLAAARKEVDEWERKAGENSSLLNDHLLKRQRELEEKLGAVDVDGAQAALQRRQQELEEAEVQLQAVADQEAQVSSELEALSKKLAESKKERDRMRDDGERGEAAAAEESRVLDGLVAQRSALLNRQEELARKIRDLGSLPNDAFEKYRHLSIKEIQKKLSDTARKLDKFSSVNRKALDQYQVFTEQREELRQRQAEVDASAKKIKELIQTLDMRKDAAIERTFKQVSREFRAIFSELVPGAKGELVMKRKDLTTDGDADDQEEERPSTGVQRYVAVMVRAHFGAGATTSMARLSGGQKTLVALALIFAIQRCDPAPFYLFDEIDAALDPQYRTTVAKMLRKQADHSENRSQYIVTTFHPQLIMEADKIYGVSHTNRISRIDVITRDDALEFMSTDEDQARQQSEAAQRAAQEAGNMEQD